MKIKLTVSYLFNIFLLVVFCVTRIYRNSLGYNKAGIGGIWNVITLCFLIVAILVTLRLLRRDYPFPKPIIWAVVSALLAQINCVFFINEVSISYVYNYLMIGYFAVVLIVFYTSAQKEINDKERIVSIVLFFIIVVMSFVSVFLFRTGTLSFSMVSNAYYALCVLPFILLLTKKKSIRTVAYVLIGAVVVFSGKRLGLIAFVIFIMIIAWFRIVKKNSIQNFIKTSIVILLSVFVFVFLYLKLESIYNLQLLQRMTTLFSDGGSGRSTIYRQIWEAMKSSSLIEWIVGHGYESAGSVIQDHDTAHDDFLEILYDYGIFPLIFFVLFYIRLMYEGIIMARVKYEYADLYIGGVVISLLLSLFSTYCISYAYVTCGMAFLGTMLGKWRRARESIRGVS